MKRRAICCSALMILVLVSTSSCATTRLKTVWKDDAFDARLGKVLVMGCAQKEATRRAFEDEFSNQLRAKGVGAVASHTIFSSADQLTDKAAVLRRIQPMGFNAVLITQLVDQKTTEQYYPPEMEYRSGPGYYGRPYGHGGGWHSQYVGHYERVSRPGYTVELLTLILETSVYALEGERLIYSALSETEVTEVTNEDIRGFITIIVASLAAKGLL